VIRVFLNWLHRITEPPPEPPLPDVRVGDVWDYPSESPFSAGWEVIAIRDGWAQYRAPRGGVGSSKLRDFVRDFELRFRIPE